MVLAVGRAGGQAGQTGRQVFLQAGQRRLGGGDFSSLQGA